MLAAWKTWYLKNRIARPSAAIIYTLGEFNFHITGTRLSIHFVGFEFSPAFPRSALSLVGAILKDRSSNATRVVKQSWSRVRETSLHAHWLPASLTSYRDTIIPFASRWLLKLTSFTINHGVHAIFVMVNERKSEDNRNIRLRFVPAHLAHTYNWYTRFTHYRCRQLLNYSLTLVSFIQWA